MKKKQYIKQGIVESCNVCNNIVSPCKECMKKIILVDKYCDANIPIDYFNKELVDFSGDSQFKDFLASYENNIGEVYKDGKSWCFAGGVGRGKTFGACAILKKAISLGFSSWYDTMFGIISKINDVEFKSFLMNVDFLVLDEIDSRFLPQSQGGIDYIASNFEMVLRTRCQNLMPTIICTNEEDGDISKGFNDIFKVVFESLKSQYIETCFVGGKDFRKQDK